MGNLLNEKQWGSRREAISQLAPENRKKQELVKTGYKTPDLCKLKVSDINTLVDSVLTSRVETEDVQGFLPGFSS